MPEIVPAQSKVQGHSAIDFPIVLYEGCGVQHQNSLVQVRGYGSGRWADRRTTLEERPICSEIQQVDEVKVRTNETVGEIVQVLYT